MSGFDGKSPGKNSGVTADDLVSGDLNTMVPGKKNIVQTYETGSAYADNGAKCEGEGSAPGCFLSARQRDRLMQLTLKRLTTAQTNYKIALVQLKIERLIETEDDLSWMITMLLDLASAQLAGAAATALNKIKGSAARDASGFGLGMDVLGEEGKSSWPSNVGTAIRDLSDKTVETTTKTGFDVAKKKISKVMKAEANAAEKNDKAVTLSYIDQLEANCDIAFDDFTEHALASVDDAQLVVLYNGLAPQYHSIPQYEASLSEKIARFKKAGIGDIGQKVVRPARAHVALLYTNKRCVWLTDPDGNRRLWTYTVTSGNQADPWNNGRDPDLEQVPDEFVEAALAKTEQKWGPTPSLDHPMGFFMKDMGSLPSKKPIPRLEIGGNAPQVASSQGKQ